MKFSEANQILGLQSQIMNKKLPIRTAYKFTKFFNALNKENAYYNETLQGIIKEYGQVDENGQYILTEDKQNIKIQEGRESECIEKIKELNTTDIQLEYVPTFTLDELDSLEIETKYIFLLMPYITEN